MDIEQLEILVADKQIAVPSVDQRRAKIDALTGLRFLAVCLVFMSYVPFSGNLPIFMQSFINSGSNGVTLFFILSGFVLCYNYYDAFTKRFVVTLKPFLVARFAHIYPLFFFLFLLFFAATAIPDQLQHHFNLVLAQITLTQAWSSDLNVVLSYNSPSWALSVEAFLSICFPLLIILLFKHVTKIWQLCLIGVIAFSAIFSLATWFSLHNLTSIYSSALFWLYIFPVTRLGDFILGCVAARIYVLHTSKPISAREQILGVTLLLLSIAAVLVLMGSSDPFLTPYKFDSGYSLFFIVIIYALARYVSPLSTFLSTKVLVLLGEASYAFYLLYYVFIGHGLTTLSISARPSAVLYLVMQFLLIVVTALGAYTYVETPIREKLQQVFA